MHDSDRFAWKARYMARACSLLACWHRPRPAAPPAPAGRVTAEELDEAARDIHEMRAGQAGWGEAEARLVRMVPRLIHEMTALAADLDVAKTEAGRLSTALDEAGITKRGEDDTLSARLQRLIDDANADSDRLEALREKAEAVIKRADDNAGILGDCGVVNMRLIDALRIEVEKP